MIDTRQYNSVDDAHEFLNDIDADFWEYGVRSTNPDNDYECVDEGGFDEMLSALKRYTDGRTDTSCFADPRPTDFGPFTEGDVGEYGVLYRVDMGELRFRADIGTVPDASETDEEVIELLDKNGGQVVMQEKAGENLPPGYEPIIFEAVPREDYSDAGTDDVTVVEVPGDQPVTVESTENGTRLTTR